MLLFQVSKTKTQSEDLGNPLEQQKMHALNISQLRRDFYREFDQLQASRWVARVIARGSPEGRLIGAGAHFSTYLFEASGRMPVAISISHEGFRQGLTMAVDRWLEALSFVAAQDWPLVPPMRGWREGERAVYAMPFAEKNLGVRGEARSAVAPLETELGRKLAAAGLVLDDVWQIHEVRGVSMIIDWSDLARRGRG